MVLGIVNVRFPFCHWSINFDQVIFISLMISDVEIFSCACWPSVWLLWKNAYSGPLPIFYSNCFSLLLSCMSSLYILDINPLSDISFANRFFPFNGLPFHFVDGFLALLTLLFSYMFNFFLPMSMSSTLISFWLLLILNGAHISGWSICWNILKLRGVN